MRLTSTWLAIGGLALSFTLPASLALAAPDAKQVADDLVAAVTATGKSTATYGDATASDNAVTITGWEMKNSKGETISIPTLVITDPVARDKGGFTASGISFDGGSMTANANQIAWKTGAVTDATVPSPVEIKAKAHIKPFSNVTVGGLDITGPNLDAPIAVSAIDVTIDAADDGTPRDFDLKVTGIAIAAATFDKHPQQKALLDSLGYSDFVINVALGAGYDSTSDTFTLRNFTIDIANVGKLDILAKVTGVSLGGMINGSAAADAKSKAKLENLSIRFDNAGVVERALDMQAKMIGASREDVVNQLSGALPFMLNVIGNQDFQNKVASAATTFLKEPKSIAVSAQPATPVSFGDIAIAAKQKPNTLPDLLAVEITADQ